MRKIVKTKIIQIPVFTLFYLCIVVYAQNCWGANFPFPQNTIYSFGIMPEGRNSADAENSYINWKNTYIAEEGASGCRRVLWDDLSSTVSEGIGYGMLLAVNYNDKNLFDDLWCYYNLHLDKNGLMHWKIDSNGDVIGQNAATDADEDVAFSLILADAQWSSQGEVNYLNDAIDMINKIFQHEVETGTYVLKPGDVWGGSDITNPSYFAPAYYRIFKLVTGNSEWDNVILKSYEVLEKAVHSVTGLVPDWCDANGNEVSSFSYNYTYDAVRTPLRIALDYIWFATPQAYEFSIKITDFARGIGIQNVVDGYKLDGTPIGQWHNSAFVGTFAVGSMGTDPSYQNFCNESYTENITVQGDSYYNMSLKTLTLFLQTGNLFNPETTPYPDVKANLSDAPISITQNDILSVTLQLNAGDSMGNDAD